MGLVFWEIYSTRCSFCQMMQGEMARLEAKFGKVVKFEKRNTDDLKTQYALLAALRQKYGEIDPTYSPDPMLMLPTYVIECDGAIIKKQVGLMRNSAGAADPVVTGAALDAALTTMLHPPDCCSNYVMRVVVKQVIETLAPPSPYSKHFASFENEDAMNDCEKPILKYDATWAETGTGTRQKIERVNQPLDYGRDAYIFLLFGPTGAFKKSRDISKDLIQMTLTGAAPDGSPIKKPVQLDEAFDDDLGRFYFGKYRPDNTWNDTYKLTIQTSVFFAPAVLCVGQPEDSLDSNPSTIPRLVDNPNTYDITGLESGADSNHTIEIAVRPTHVALPPDIYEQNNDFDHAAVIDPVPVDLNELTLHTAQDEDFFLIKFGHPPLPVYDLNPAIQELIDQHMWLEIAPQLVVSIEAEPGKCLVADIANSMRQWDNRFSQLGHIVSFNIIRPIKQFPEGELYLAICPIDFAFQGPINYELHVRHKFRVRIVLHRLPSFSWSDEWWRSKDYEPLPYLPENILGLGDSSTEGVTMFETEDFHTLVDNLEQFIPYYLDKTGMKDRRTRAIETARIKLRLGSIAELIGEDKIAEQNYKQSQLCLHDNGAPQMESIARGRLNALSSKQKRGEL